MERCDNAMKRCDGAMKLPSQDCSIAPSCCAHLISTDLHSLHELAQGQIEEQEWRATFQDPSIVFM
ncbi:hypothetical protein CHS0354_030684, partial [Potamilus streckersoni]